VVLKKDLILKSGETREGGQKLHEWSDQWEMYVCAAGSRSCRRCRRGQGEEAARKSRLSARLSLVPCFAYPSTTKMEAVRSSETSVNYSQKWRQYVLPKRR
jgi:hypothetical protein